MANTWIINKLTPILKWPPPPEEKMDLTEGFEKALGINEKVEALTLPGICPECGKHIGSCRCPVVGECLHKQIKKMDWPDGSYSEVCIKCLQTRLIWEQGESEWQEHKYKSLADWYKEALEVQLRWEKL